MNNILTNRRLVPAQVITIYTEPGANRYSPEYYLEEREVRQAGGKSILMAPKPLAEETLRTIAMSFLKKNAQEINFGGLIAEHLLYGENKPGVSVVMWYRPAMTRTLNFAGHLNIKGDCVVQVPPTLWLAHNKKLYIYALMTSKRPEMNTKIYNAPFFNIYHDGNVCLGSAQVGRPGKTYEDEADRFERAFFMAEQNGGQSKDACKTPLPTLWNQLIKKKGPFPCKEELKQHKFKTLGELMQRLLGNNLSNE